jgi:hypothetical protein
MHLRVINEISEGVEYAYTRFLDAYTVMEAEQEEGRDCRDLDDKFDRVNRAFGELRDHLNQAESGGSRRDAVDHQRMIFNHASGLTDQRRARRHPARRYGRASSNDAAQGLVRGSRALTMATRRKRARE